jgi:hypothetical protein
MGTGEEVAAAHYRTRAESFLRAMRHIDDRGLFDDEEVDRMANAAALLAVHAAIALGDAILMLKTSSRSTAQDHREAVGTLKKLCGKIGVDSRGIKHFTWRVAHKDHFAYGEARVTLDEVKSAVLNIQRLARWTLETFPEIGLEATHEPD